MSKDTLSIPDGQADLATLKDRINHYHAACVEAVNRGLQHALAAGRLLIEAKARCQHGQWIPWLAENFDGSERTGQTYMQVAKRWPEIEAQTQRVADLPYRDAVKMLAGPRRETVRTGKADPPLWSIKETNRRVIKQLDIRRAIGGIFNWADENGVKHSHKISRWLCPAQGWMNQERALSMILALEESDSLDRVRDTRQSDLDLLTEVACYHAGIRPLEDGDFPIVCMCDLAIGIHKFMGDKGPDEEPHRIAPCEKYGDACVFSYCQSEADRQKIADTVEDWLANGPPEDVFEWMFAGTEAGVAR